MQNTIHSFAATTFAAVLFATVLSSCGRSPKSSIIARIDSEAGRVDDFSIEDIKVVSGVSIPPAQSAEYRVLLTRKKKPAGAITVVSIGFYKKSGEPVGDSSDIQTIIEGVGGGGGTYGTTSADTLPEAVPSVTLTIDDCGVGGPGKDIVCGQLLTPSAPGPYIIEVAIASLMGEATSGQQNEASTIFAVPITVTDGE